jgi:hypothetical protein
MLSSTVETIPTETIPTETNRHLASRGTGFRSIRTLILLILGRFQTCALEAWNRDVTLSNRVNSLHADCQKPRHLHGANKRSR